ncbi:SH3 domain-containing protein [Sphingomonas kaistensis]|uniref:SH3 domain-containing protein n=1 Tax=Sphingomonas kaistensis TaxID=298708 RepID=UPI003CC8402B
MRKPVRIDRASGTQPTSARLTTLPATPARSTQQDSSVGQGCGGVLAIIFILFLLGKCSSDFSEAPRASPQAAVSESAYVAARSLNCRREPNASAAVSEGLTRNIQVIVAERRGEWARVTRAGGDCWVSSSFLASAPGESTAAADSTSGAQGLMSAGTGSTVAAGGAGYVARKRGKSTREYSRSRHRGASRNYRSSKGSYSGSSCPCSGSRVCIGPRGGRYCITSGGNKRYGV